MLLLWTICLDPRAVGRIICSAIFTHSPGGTAVCLCVCYESCQRLGLFLCQLTERRRQCWVSRGILPPALVTLWGWGGRRHWVCVDPCVFCCVDVSKRRSKAPEWHDESLRGKSSPLPSPPQSLYQHQRRIIAPSAFLLLFLFHSCVSLDPVGSPVTYCDTDCQRQMTRARHVCVSQWEGPAPASYY